MPLTPSKYWRVPCALDAVIDAPVGEYLLPDSLVDRKAPPACGHGITIAAYDVVEQMGLLRWLGIITGTQGRARTVEWRAASAQIWVDTPTGRSFWENGAFGFAKTKVAGYGLHELWQDHFDGFDLRDSASIARRPEALGKPRRIIASERLIPIEVIGAPLDGPRAGVVYVLKSAYGFKVGRTRNIPARMRAFGVHLPIMYSILLCSWFEDCHLAERRYHEQFANKRINGEWFDLDESDIMAIRMRL